jgi:PKD repeat protein
MQPTEDPNVQMTGDNVYSGYGLVNALAAAFVNSPPTISSPLTASGNVGSPFSYTITAVGAPTITFATPQNLPLHLSFDGTSTISGIPATQGTFNIALSASNTKGSTNATLVLTVGPPVPVAITSGPTGNPNPSFVGASVTFAISATGSGQGITTTWTFGDGGSATGASVSHTYTALGSYTVQAKLVDGNGQTATGTLTENVVPKAPLVFKSAPTAQPNPAGIGETITFSASATGNGNLTYTWNFGDGSAAVTAASVTHAYAASGKFSATLTVVDSTAQMLTATIPVTISPILIGTGPDSNGDGVSDSIAILAGTNPYDPKSTPLTNPIPQPLLVKSMLIRLNFLHANRDSIQIGGTVSVAAGPTLAGSRFIFNIGGVEDAVLLNAQGRGKNGNGSAVALSVRTVNGAVPAQTAKVTLTLAHNTYSTALAADGLANGNVYSTVYVPVQILFQGTIYSTVPHLTYRALAGRRGVAR